MNKIKWHEQITNKIIHTLFFSSQKKKQKKEKKRNKGHFSFLKESCLMPPTRNEFILIPVGIIIIFVGEQTSLMFFKFMSSLTWQDWMPDYMPTFALSFKDFFFPYTNENM